MRIAVASGKGGTGKTSVAVALARRLDDCVFMDCDVEAPNAHLFLQPEIAGLAPVEVMMPVVDESKCIGCGECSRVCRFHAIAALGTTIVVFPELCHGCGGCELICEPGAITEGRHRIGDIEWGSSGNIDFLHGRLKIGEPMSPPLIRALKKKVPADTDREIVIDCPPGTTCPMIEAVRGSDYCILVTEPTPFGLHDLVMAAGAVEELGIPAGVIVNRSGIGDEGVQSFCREKGLPVLLEIPNSRKIAEAYAAGQDMFHAHPSLKDSFRMVLGAIERKLAA